MKNVRLANKSTTKKLHLVATQKAKTTPEYDETAWAIWTYYRDNKSRFVSDIRDYRNAIVADIHSGTPIATAFAPYRDPDRSFRAAA